MKDKQVMTVCGPIAPDEMGVTLAHQHVILNLLNWFTEPQETSKHWIIDAPVTMEILGLLHMDPTISKDNLVVDDIEMCIKELQELRMWGGKSIVDTCPIGAGRDPIAQRKISIASGINIVCASGWYVANAHPPYIKEKTEEELCDIIIKELTEGCMGTDRIKAGIIKVGLGTSPHSPFTNDDEKKVLLAASKAQVRTGRAFTIHPNVFDVYNGSKNVKDRCHHVYLDLMEKEGVDFEKFYFSHIDWWAPDLDLQKSILDRGVGISYDGFNEEEYFISLGYGLNSSVREKLLEAGYEKQIMPSCECFMKIHYKKYGGYGNSYLLEYIIPILKNHYGVSEKTIETMLVENPQKYLAFTP
jgi:phosphotriesterase-related protein